MLSTVTSMSHTSTPSPFQKKKSLGQNFLTSPIVPGWLCDAAVLTPGDIVFEIGPGTGALTQELLARGARVIALEADERAISYLHEHFATPIKSGQLTLHHGDARSLELTTFGLLDHQFLVVANIPYYLSGLILRQLLDSTCQPHTIVLLMQKELVERVARDKKSSLLSLSVRAFGDPYYIKTVSRGHFSPPPKVDSAILAIRNIDRTRLSGLRSEEFFSLLHIGLGKKRKQLLSNLSAHYDRALLTRVFAQLSVDNTVRGEDLPLATWTTLATALQVHTK